MSITSHLSFLRAPAIASSSLALLMALGVGGCAVSSADAPPGHDEDKEATGVTAEALSGKPDFVVMAPYQVYLGPAESGENIPYYHLVVTIENQGTAAGEPGDLAVSIYTDAGKLLDFGDWPMSWPMAVPKTSIPAGGTRSFDVIIAQDLSPNYGSPFDVPYIGDFTKPGDPPASNCLALAPYKVSVLIHYGSAESNTANNGRTFDF